MSEILQCFQFSKRDISTARCKCTIYIFTYKGIKVVIRTEFINMTVLLPMKAFFKTFFNFLSEAEFNFSCNKKLLYFNVRNWIVFRRAEFRCSGSLFSMLLYKNCISFKFTIDNFEKKDDTCPLVDTTLSAWIELSLGRCKRCHEHSMVKFVTTRGYLLLPSCVCYWTSVSLRRLYIG